MAQCQPSIWIYHLKQLLWLISLVEILRGQGGNSEDIAVYCPPQPFVDGEVINITCEINRTSISNAGCVVPPKRVDFKVILSSGLLTLCSPDYPPSSCAQNTTKGACFCAYQNGDISTYQYNLIGNFGHQGGNFTCDLCASPLKPPSTKSSGNCTSIIFETTTAAATTTTTAVTTTVTKSTTSEASSSSLSSLSPSGTGSTSSGQPVTRDGEPDCKWWCILLIIIGIILLIIIIIIIIIIVVRRKRHRKWAIAIEDWNGCTEILEFKEGDVITVLEHEGSFWKGEIRGQAGSFPKDFVTVMKDSGSGDMKVQASQGWKQNDKLTFRGGDRILIIQQKETIWKGELKNQIGWFPCEKVKLEKCCGCCGCCGCCVRTQGDSQGIPLNSVHNSPTA